ncbi:fimbrial protein (plasmid) [Klebsiella aerogenes]|uniref:fimbrial protein n=1 Tax=Klebsiella aerogenes TaxID=548 RepID=UPI002A7F5A4D|nr:fimbrial protein [Klebsiella aerogenes]WPS11049.1 fimbrial protein [Klebsiella aerogenes]
MFLKRIVKKILLLLAIIIPGIQFASAACWLEAGSGNIGQTINLTLPLSGTISIPESTPVGSAIYRGFVTDSRDQKVSVVCDKSAQFYDQTILNPQPALAEGWTPPAGERVYKTSLQGVGLHLFTPSGQMNPNSACVNSIGCYYHPLSVWAYRLVKTGPISPGVINGSSLPQLTQNFGQSGSMVKIITLTPSGNVTITTPTCVTPDVTVDMGSWDIKKFTGKNSTTDWRDASIQMINCQRFYGSNKYTSYNLAGQVTSVTQSSNYWTLQLTPQNGIINSSTGIMSIDSTPVNSANGLGIQLSYGTTASAGTDLVNFGLTKTSEIPTTGSTTITIPMAARYIQTENTVKPGKANGKITFTITYK